MTLFFPPRQAQVLPDAVKSFVLQNGTTYTFPEILSFYANESISLLLLVPWKKQISEVFIQLEVSHGNTKFLLVPYVQFYSVPGSQQTIPL